MYPNFVDCHEVRKVKIGLCVTHDAHSFESISWKVKLKLSYDVMFIAESDSNALQLTAAKVDHFASN